MVGFWHLRLFTPAWVGNGRLTQSQTIQIEMPVDDPYAPRRLVFDDITLELQSTRILLRPSRPEDALLLRIQQIALRLLDDLPHTPMVAVGLNFAFFDEAPGQPLTGLFTVADAGRLADQEFVTRSTAIKRELIHNDELLNHTVNLTANGSITFDLNYHFNAAGTAAARAIVGRDIVAIKNQANQFINSTYYP